MIYRRNTSKPEGKQWEFYYSDNVAAAERSQDWEWDWSSWNAEGYKSEDLNPEKVADTLRIGGHTIIDYKEPNARG